MVCGITILRSICFSLHTKMVVFWDPLIDSISCSIFMKKMLQCGFHQFSNVIRKLRFCGVKSFDLTVNAWHFRWAVGEPIFWRRTFWLCPSHPGIRTSLKFSLRWREEFLQFSASWLLIVCLTLQGPLTWHIAPGASSHGVVLVNPFTFLSTLEYYLVLVHLDLHLE